MSRTRLFVSILMLAGATNCAFAAEVKVLSGGAVEPGLRAFAEKVKHDLGHDLKILFNTTPQITKRLAAGEVYDIVVVPPVVIEQGAKDGKIDAGTRTPVGRVGVGIIVRDSAAAPNVATTDALKQALLAADTVVYNSASSGLYLDKLFGTMGIRTAEAENDALSGWSVGNGAPSSREKTMRSV